MERLADSAAAAVRARGLRLSAARRLVLEALAHAEGPVSAEAIAGGLGGRLPRSDLASVYRNLGTLEDAGVVGRLDVGRGPARYALAGPEPRDYVACASCGALQELEGGEVEALRLAIHERLGFVTRFSAFPIVGLCRTCARGRHRSSAQAAQ